MNFVTEYPAPAAGFPCQCGYYRYHQSQCSGTAGVSATSNGTVDRTAEVDTLDSLPVSASQDPSQDAKLDRSVKLLLGTVRGLVR